MIKNFKDMKKKFPSITAAEYGRVATMANKFKIPVDKYYADMLKNAKEEK
jgi:hypothetical protein